MSAGGIYIHFPFCVKRCLYCDFNVETPAKIPQRAYTDALLSELRTRASMLRAPVRSVYVGGGTPSLWEPAMVGEVLAAIAHEVDVVGGAEVTLEANPSEIDSRWLAAIRHAGISRLSIGVQSLEDRLLTSLERRHDAGRAQRAIEMVSSGGFESYSLDFMFGLSGQDVIAWRGELERVLALSPPHLSLYSLTVEPRTRLARMIQSGKMQLPSDVIHADMLFMARDVLTNHGFTHYEVSSYARPGHRAVHNSGYWDMSPYLGLGAGAHGFISPERWSNIRGVKAYIKAAMDDGIPTASRELLSPEIMTFERIMTGLRRLDVGVDVHDAWERYEPAIRGQEREGRLRVDGHRICLTESGIRWMDSVLLALISPKPG